MRKGETPHTLSVTLKNKRHICNAYCSCTAGSGGTCSHMVGLVETIQQFQILSLKDVPSGQACTRNRITPISVSKVVVTKAKDVRKKVPIIQKPLDCESIINIPSHKLLKKNISCCNILCTNCFNFLKITTVSQHYALKFNNSESVTCGNTTFPKDAKVKLPPWYNCLKSNPVNSIEIKQSTRGQHNKTNWYSISNASSSATEEKKPTDALLKSLFSTSTFTCAATEYGTTREKSAKAQNTVEKSTNNIHLLDYGLVINNEFPFLAATPDAKVCDKNEFGLLEIKCPYAARDMTIPQAIDNINNFVLCRENEVPCILCPNSGTITSMTPWLIKHNIFCVPATGFVFKVAALLPFVNKEKENKSFMNIIIIHNSCPGKIKLYGMDLTGTIAIKSIASKIKIVNIEIVQFLICLSVSIYEHFATEIEKLNLLSKIF
ncbi:hypothetical protein KUTeg_009272 [Tegillarca granosa]|uniref:SWIM-type domain-containing protein n=1 Tax=Tegillarca granosa TaxID=220873 RepID=A0ABQ9F713_TEGGR|nr:hypothetical protein KUTeg_009272 [Tegillarca granosa]